MAAWICRARVRTWLLVTGLLLFSAIAAAQPTLYPLEERLLQRYLEDLQISVLPATLDAYVDKVLVATLERQRKAGCIAVKLSQIYSAEMLAGILRRWITMYPEKVLFGTDAFALGPDAGWEVSAWIATTSARRALAMALGAMVRDGEISMDRAKAIALMVMRGNAGALYRLGV